MFSDRATHRGIFIIDAVGFFQKSRRHLIERIEASREQAAEISHSIKCPKEIHRRWASTAEMLCHIFECRDPLWLVAWLCVSHTDHDTIRRGDADGRCTAHAKTFDRFVE